MIDTNFVKSAFNKISEKMGIKNIEFTIENENNGYGGYAMPRIGGNGSARVFMNLHPIANLAYNKKQRCNAIIAFLLHELSHIQQFDFMYGKPMRMEYNSVMEWDANLNALSFCVENENWIRDNIYSSFDMQDILFVLIVAPWWEIESKQIAFESVLQSIMTSFKIKYRKIPTDEIWEDSRMLDKEKMQPEYILRYILSNVRKNFFKNDNIDVRFVLRNISSVPFSFKQRYGMMYINLEAIQKLRGSSFVIGCVNHMIYISVAMLFNAMGYNDYYFRALSFCASHSNALNNIAKKFDGRCRFKIDIALSDYIILYGISREQIDNIANKMIGFHKGMNLSWR